MSSSLQHFQSQNQSRCSGFLRGDGGKEAEEGKTKKMVDSSVCRPLPNLFSSFVDTFVDFSVSGFLLPQNPCSNDIPVPSPSYLRTNYATPDRLIAIGDLHGDLEKTKEAFRIGSLIDASDRWIGGSTTVVQTGDVLDRGGDELKILYFMEKLKREAAKTGGKIITMNGNHEIMNVDGNFSSVTKEGLKEFRDWADWYCVGNQMKGLCLGLDKPKDPFDGIPLVFPGVRKEFVDGIRARVAALRPGGPIARRFLSNNATVVLVGDSIFVHGVVLPHHVKYSLERINLEVRDWINGVKGKHAPVNCRDVVRLRLRKFLDEKCDCSVVEHVLATIPGVKRMIMGGTVQKNGINGVCNNRAIRIDVGMSKGCGNGFAEVLEINCNSELQIFTSNPSYKEKKNVDPNPDLEKEGSLPKRNRSKKDIRVEDFMVRPDEVS